MDSDEIARRIRQIHDIEIAMDESGEGKAPLSDALRNAIPYMTPEEIKETLYRTLDKLDELYGDRTSYEELLRKEREAHELEVSNLKKEMAANEKNLTDTISEKNVRIAALEKELAQSKVATVDANHKVDSMNQDKFQGTSKKGIDKRHQTQKGRDDHKDDFDGTSGSAAPQIPDGNQKADGVETITRDQSDIEKEQAKGAPWALCPYLRPYALFRKTSMHTCSHRGAKVRAILRSFVETCKLEGISIVKYFTAFFRAVCSGRTDYENLLPATISLTV